MDGRQTESCNLLLQTSGRSCHTVTKSDRGIFFSIELVCLVPVWSSGLLGNTRTDHKNDLLVSEDGARRLMTLAYEHERRMDPSTILTPQCEDRERM